jgi:putative heme-binding domain-containing protein
MEATSGRDGRLSEGAFELLLSLVEKGGESKELSLAVGLIGNANLSKDQLLRLAPVLKQAGPVEICSLLPPYQRTSDPEVAAAFLQAMEQSRSLLSVPPTELSDIVKGYPMQFLERANALLEKLRQEEQKRLSRLDQLTAQLQHGDANRGRVVFYSEKSKCATCHRVNDEGGRIGPDLSTIGANRSSSDLLESIVFPSATLVRDYQSYNLLTTEGQTHTGLIVRDTGDEIFVQQQLGEPIQISRQNIENLVPSTVSLMPNGLDQALTENELVDVVAYLQSLKATKETASVNRK